MLVQAAGMLAGHLIPVSFVVFRVWVKKLQLKQTDVPMSAIATYQFGISIPSKMILYYSVGKYLETNIHHMGNRAK